MKRRKPWYSFGVEQKPRKPVKENSLVIKDEPHRVADTSSEVAGEIEFKPTDYGTVCEYGDSCVMDYVPSDVGVTNSY